VKVGPEKTAQGADAIRVYCYAMFLICRRVALLSALIVCGVAVVAQSGFPSNEDLRHFRSIAEPRLSPDGKAVLYRVTDATADGGKSHLWLTEIELNMPRQLTFSPAADKRGERSGEWMPDGKSILFVAERGEHAQLYRLPIAGGGEAQAFDLKVTPTIDVAKLPGYIDTGAKLVEAKPEPIDVNAYAIAPNGKWIAVMARDPESAAEKKQREDKADASWVDHEVHGTRLYLLDPETSKLAAVDVRPDVQSVTWSADSKRLLVINEGPNHASDLGPTSKAYVVEVGESMRVAELDKLPATIDHTAWSLDGAVIYFAAQAEKDAPPGTEDLYEYNVATKTIRNLTDGFMGTMSHETPIALADGSVLKGVAMGVNTAAIRIKGGAQVRVQYPTALAGSFSTNATQSGLVFLGTSSTQPVGIYYQRGLVRPPDPGLVLTNRVGSIERIPTPKTVPEHLKPVASKVVRYKSEKFTIEGLLYLPPDAATKKVPLIMDIHGGPAGAWQDGFDPFAQFLVGQGWAVFRPNIRGSSNYGTEFVASNKNDLGGGDYRDVMNGVDDVLKNYPIDESRMALIGYSYGGEMAGFVVGKTNRFKAIVSGAPVIDQFSEYGTEDGSWYDRWYYGKPWEHFEDAWRQSPLAGAAKASTPFLLLQGETDKTDPLGESQQMYRALRQMNVQVELVTYPREDHGGLARGMFGAPSTEPWHGFDARRRVVEFIKKYFDAVK